MAKDDYVYDFEDSGKELIELVGGKGAFLGEMCKLGLSVPPGFTISNKASKFFINGDYTSIWPNVESAVKRLEGKTGKKFGDKKNPLLVSVRSGAVVSMPGIMDTVLNVGLTKEMINPSTPKWMKENYEKLIKFFGGKIFEWSRFQANSDNYKQIITQNLDSRIAEWLYLMVERYGFAQFNDPQIQLINAVSRVYRSWNSRTAKDYRAVEGIPDEPGTAVTIQSMVFGNMDKNSLTATFFTRNPSTGDKELFGSFISMAQGDDLVGGSNSRPLSELNKSLRKKFGDFSNTLEEKLGCMQEVEVTVESGKPYLLQTRKGKMTNRASIRVMAEQTKSKKMTEKDFLIALTPEKLSDLNQKEIDPSAKYRVAGHGTPVSPGIVCGYAAFNYEEIIGLQVNEKTPAILVKEKLDTNHIKAIAAAGGIFTKEGNGNTISHAVVVARGKNKPCVTGVSELIWNKFYGWEFDGHPIQTGTEITLNANTGEVIFGKVKLVESKPGDEISYVDELIRKYDKRKWIVALSSLEKIAQVPNDMGILYIPNFSEQQKAELRRAIMGDEKKLAAFKERVNKEYQAVIEASKSRYPDSISEFSKKRPPLVLGMISQETLGYIAGKKDRNEFRIEWMTKLQPRQKAFKEKPEPDYSVGKTVSYNGHKVKIIGTCDCGNPQVADSHGYSFCIRKESNPALNKIANLGARIKEEEASIEELKKTDIQRVYDTQLKAANKAIEEFGDKSTIAADYDPSSSLKFEIKGVNYEVLTPQGFYSKRLQSAKEAIQNGQ